MKVKLCKFGPKQIHDKMAIFDTSQKLLSTGFFCFKYLPKKKPCIIKEDQLKCIFQNMSTLNTV